LTAKNNTMSNKNENNKNRFEDVFLAGLVISINRRFLLLSLAYL